MIIFENGELEIAMVTYNRSNFIAEWLKCCYEHMKKRNIHFSIYDSSTNNDTEQLINDFKIANNDSDIEYHHVDSDISIGYKPMFPILESKSKYVWVAGDSIYWDFDVLDSKLFPLIKEEIDIAVIHIAGLDEGIKPVYNDRNDFLKAAFLSMTCIGASVYKTAMFEPLKNDDVLRKECDLKYRENYAYAWLGYFAEMFYMNDYTASIVLTHWKQINLKKIYSWQKRYYHSNINDLCGLMDCLSDKYRDTDEIIRYVWTWLDLDSSNKCYAARKYGDLNPETYMEFKNSGMLDRCTLHGDRLERFAYAKDEDLDKLLDAELNKEKEHFKELCYQNADKVKNESKNRRLWIYGAGMGGEILADCLSERDIPVCGFLDMNAKILKGFKGMTVSGLDEADLKDAYIVISLRYPTAYCLSPLLERGVERKNIFYISVDAD